MRDIVIKTIIYVSVTLWVISLVLPAYTACENLQVEGPMPGPTMGWHVLLTGWAGPLGLQGLFGDLPGRAYPPECDALLPALDLGRYRETSTSMLSWFANPLWWLCIYRLARQRRFTPYSATATAVLALLALQPHQSWFDHTIASETPAIGAYVWAIAVSLPLLASIAFLLPARQAASGP